MLASSIIDKALFQEVTKTQIENELIQENEEVEKPNEEEPIARRLRKRKVAEVYEKTKQKSIYEKVLGRDKDNLKSRVTGRVFQRQQQRKMQEKLRKFKYQESKDQDQYEFYTTEQNEAFTNMKHPEFANHKELVMTLTHSDEKSIEWVKKHNFIMQDEAPCPKCISENRTKKGTMTY